MSEIDYRALIEHLGGHNEVIGAELTRRKIAPGLYTWEQSLERMVVGLVQGTQRHRPTFEEWKEQLDKDFERFGNATDKALAPPKRARAT